MDEPKIVYEDKNFLGVYKPAGMLVHPIRANGKWQMASLREVSHGETNGKMPIANREQTLVDWIVKKYPEIKNVGDDPEQRPGIVHRLDRDTSGIMIVPRNQKYFEYFKNLFKTRDIKKTYLAVVSGEPKNREGVIDKPIGIKNGSVKRSIHSKKMLKSALTRYKVKKSFVFNGLRFSLLEVYPETGRTHQIRVHLASIGHPITGDRLYGGKKQPSLAGFAPSGKKAFTDRLMLHAYSIEFSLPNGSRFRIEAEADFD